MSEPYKPTWAEIYCRLSTFPKEGSCYGVPRGGAVVAGLTGRAVDTPEQADFYVDDIIDSGATLARYKSLLDGKPFYALFDKRAEQGLGWVVFPWEGSSEGDAEDIVRRQLQFIGENALREGLAETPARVVRSWGEIFKGYREDPAGHLKFFEDGCPDTDEMVMLRRFEFFSTCEHHLQPFHGVISIAYIPDGKMLGVSKLARIADCFARRLQIQERLTSQIADFLDESLKPKGVMVVVRAKHLCIAARGVKKQAGEMVTSAIRGAFTKESARSEFLQLEGRE